MSFWEKNKGGKGLKVKSAKKTSCTKSKSQKKNTNKRKPIAANSMTSLLCGGKMDGKETRFLSHLKSVLYLVHARLNNM